MALLACGWPNNKSYKWSDTRELMEYGMEQYQPHKVKELEPVIPDLVIAEGQTREIEETARTSVRIDRRMDCTAEGTILMKEGEKIVTEITLDKIRKAPVREGDLAGHVDYYLDGELYLREELVVEQTVLKIDFFWCMKKILDKMILKGH